VIIGCDRPVSDGKACDDIQHQQMQTLHLRKGVSAFSLTERLQRQSVSHLNDSMGSNLAVAIADLEVEENIEWFEEENSEIRLFHTKNSGCVGIRDDGIAGNTDNLVGTSDISPADGLHSAAPCNMKNELGNKQIKAQFGCRQTHNEQTMLRSCGVFVTSLCVDRIA
jgi:hypothetical protein